MRQQLYYSRDRATAAHLAHNQKGVPNSTLGSATKRGNMKLPLLKKVSKLLNKTFHIDEFMDNALAVSFSQGDKPFALLIVEEDSPDVLNYSVAVDAVDPYSVADVALRLISICKLDLSEPFFIDTSGEIYWSDEAYAEFMSLQPDSDGTQAFLNLESPSKLVN